MEVLHGLHFLFVFQVRQTCSNQARGEKSVASLGLCPCREESGRLSFVLDWGFWPHMSCDSDGLGRGPEEMVPSFTEKAQCILGQLY